MVKDCIKQCQIQARMKLESGEEMRGCLKTIEGYRGRLSDIMNNDTKFLVMSNVDVKDGAGREYRLNFACINKAAVIWIHPIEETKNENI